MSELKTAITKDGQRYVDEPIHVRPKRPDIIERSIAQTVIVGYAKPRVAVELPIPVSRADVEPVKSPIVVGHERVLLRWMTSDGKGGLKPREGQ